MQRGSMEKRYQAIPDSDLKKIYEAHNHLNFTTPSTPWQLVVITFGFVDLEVIHRMKELYFHALSNSSTWPAVSDQFAPLAREIEDAFPREMEEALRRAQPVA